MNVKRFLFNELPEEEIDKAISGGKRIEFSDLSLLDYETKISGNNGLENQTITIDNYKNPKGKHAFFFKKQSFSIDDVSIMHAVSEYDNVVFLNRKSLTDAYWYNNRVYSSVVFYMHLTECLCPRPNCPCPKIICLKHGFIKIKPVGDIAEKFNLKFDVISITE